MLREQFNRTTGCLLVLVGIAISGCSKNDHPHTTVVTQIPPPQRQVLTIVAKPVPTPVSQGPIDPTADPKKPLIVFHLENGKTFKVGDEVPVAFTVMNAKLKGEGGDFRVRYIVDDDDMKWLDTADPFVFTGWIPGKHTIRIELIGPDGWPFKNGNANIVTKEIEVVSQ